MSRLVLRTNFLTHYQRECSHNLEFQHSGNTDRQRRLHLGGKYSDLTVKCNYRQWSVHKAIVCSRSGFFDGACSHQFREAETGVIDLSEDDEEAVEQMIHCACWMGCDEQAVTNSHIRFVPSRLP